MQYDRIFSNESGSSSFGTVELELAWADLAPPAPPVGASQPQPVRSYVLVRIPPGWTEDWHPTPRRQLWIGLAGELESTVTSGEARRYGPGSVVLLDDTTGTGHTTRVVGNADVVGMMLDVE